MCITLRGHCEGQAQIPLNAEGAVRIGGCRLRVGLAMLVLQAISFLLFLLSAALLLGETLASLAWWRALRASPSDRLAHAVHAVMARVCAPPLQPPALPACAP